MIGKIDLGTPITIKINDSRRLIHLQKMYGMSSHIPRIEIYNKVGIIILQHQHRIQDVLREQYK